MNYDKHTAHEAIWWSEWLAFWWWLGRQNHQYIGHLDLAY